MPTYVLAYVYAHLLGWAALPSNCGKSSWGRKPGSSLPIASRASTLVMALDTFPFVYLLAEARS